MARQPHIFHSFHSCLSQANRLVVQISQAPLTQLRQTVSDSRRDFLSFFKKFLVFVYTVRPTRESRIVQDGRRLA